MVAVALAVERLTVAFAARDWCGQRSWSGLVEGVVGARVGLESARTACDSMASAIAVASVVAIMEAKAKAMVAEAISVLLACSSEFWIGCIGR